MTKGDETLKRAVLKTNLMKGSKQTVLNAAGPAVGQDAEAPQSGDLITVPVGSISGPGTGCGANASQPWGKEPEPDTGAAFPYPTLPYPETPVNKGYGINSNYYYHHLLSTSEYLY